MADDLYNYVEDTGVIVPDTADIKAEVEQEFKTALGQQMSTAPDTPQGRLISIETDARASVARNNALLANQINPNYASGLFLEAICALLGITRNAPTYSTIAGVRLTGIPLTQIAAGSRAKTKAGDFFATTATVILSSAGVATVDFIALETGPVTAGPGDLSVVVDAVLGWETVYNDNHAVPGQDIQSDISLRLMRQQRLAQQGISTVEAQISGLYSVPGVRSLSFLENTSHDYQEIHGIALKPHSVWACVYGGTDTDIAASLLEDKTAGAAWNGAVNVEVLEPNSGITYNVQFDRPTEVPIRVQATVKFVPGVSYPQDAIINAMLDYAAGEIDGERGFIVGQNVSPFELAGAINIYQPGVYVQSVLMSRDDGELAGVEIPIALNEIPTLNASDITINIIA